MHFLLPLTALLPLGLANPATSPSSTRPYCFQKGRDTAPNPAPIYETALGQYGSLAAACRYLPECKYLRVSGNVGPDGRGVGDLFNVTLDAQGFEELSSSEYPDGYYYAYEREGLDKCFAGNALYLAWPVTGPLALAAADIDW